MHAEIADAGTVLLELFNGLNILVAALEGLRLLYTVSRLELTDEVFLCSLFHLVDRVFDDLQFRNSICNLYLASLLID